MIFQLNGVIKSLSKLALTYENCADSLMTPLRDALLALDADNELYCGNYALIGLIQQINQASEQLAEQLSARFFSYTGSDQSTRGSL